MAVKNPIPVLGRVMVTLIVVAIAIIVGWQLWVHYEVEPWTRDGRVKANIIEIAPDVTGQVTAVYVRDNQPVKAGQVLFEIDRARFELALRQAQATEQAQKALLAQTQKEARRNEELQQLVSQEAREQGLTRVDQAKAALAQAEVSLDVAKLNLNRTRVVSSVNGYVTNLDLRTGSYVTAARPVMALVDRDSFYVEGYFEETKLPGIHIGDLVSIRLMGDKQDLTGHVESIAGGIADRDRSPSPNLLPNVNPTFSWVRLAQRIPVRVALDPVPDSVRLVAGQTVTVDVRPASASPSSTSLSTPSSPHR
jgi:multidrug resistance efflux pump